MDSASGSDSQKRKFSHRHKVIKKPAVKEVDGVRIKYARKVVDKKQKKSKKAFDNAPIELGTKRPSNHLKPQIVQNTLYKARDPRFDSKTSDLNEEAFHKNYGHVFEMREKETKELKKQLSKVKSEKKKEQMHAELVKLEALNKEVQLKQRQSSLEEEWKTQERELTKQGKKPYFLSKSAKKELALVDRFIELKKSGLLRKYIEKRRKRNAAKEHKLMPERPSLGDD